MVLGILGVVLYSCWFWSSTRGFYFSSDFGFAWFGCFGWSAVLVVGSGCLVVPMLLVDIFRFLMVFLVIGTFLFVGEDAELKGCMILLNRLVPFFALVLLTSNLSWNSLALIMFGLLSASSLAC